MDPDLYWQARTEAALSEYWHSHRRHCLLVLKLRIAAVVIGAFSIGVGVLCFLTALAHEGAALKTLDLALAASEFTMAVILARRWPKWPAVDPAIPRIMADAEDLKRQRREGA